MAKSFTVNFTGDPETLVQRAEVAARQNGAQFTGDANAGQFSGSGVQGRYQVSGNTITITIDQKPFFAPWSLVESQIKGFFTT